MVTNRGILQQHRITRLSSVCEGDVLLLVASNQIFAARLHQDVAVRSRRRAGQCGSSDQDRCFLFSAQDY